MKSTNPLKLSLHDAELLSFYFDKKLNLVQLSFQREDESFISVRLLGLEHVKSSMFAHQNIVNRFLIASKAEMSKESFLYWLDWLHDDYATLTQKSKENLWEKCQKGELELIYLEPSVGTELVVLCERMQVDENNRF